MTKGIRFIVMLSIAHLTSAALGAQARLKGPLKPTQAIVAPSTLATPNAESKADAKPIQGAEFKMLGMIAAAYSEDTYALTLGGPRFGFSYGWFSLSVSLFPSLVYSNVYKNASAATPLRPNLGAGFEIGFGKVSIVTPVYYMPGDQYRYTFGIGYRF